MDAEARAQQQAKDEAQCSGFGFKPGTDAFANCMMGISDRRQQQQAEAQRQAAADKRMAEEREKDRQAMQNAASQSDADTQRQIKMGEDVENEAAREAEMNIPKIDSADCVTTTETTQSGNAGSSTSKTVCHH